MRYLNTVYVRDHQARVGHRRGSLVVKQEAGTTRVPLAGIDALVLLGSGQVSSDALAACVKRGVRVASLRRSGAVRFVVGGPMSGNVHLRMAQHAAVLSEDHSLKIAQAIVAAKLQSSRRMLLRWSRDAHDTSLRKRLQRRAEMIAERIARVPGTGSGDHLRGLEGDGARIYFRGLGQHLEETGIRFSARTRRPPRDPVNALMSFGYGLLVTEFVGSINAVGCTTCAASTAIASSCPSSSAGSHPQGTQPYDTGSRASSTPSRTASTSTDSPSRYLRPRQ